MNESFSATGFTAASTTIVAVAVAVSPLLSVIVYTKLSVPTKPALGVYTIWPSTINAVPFDGEPTLEIVKRLLPELLVSFLSTSKVTDEPSVTVAESFTATGRTFSITLSLPKVVVKVLIEVLCLMLLFRARWIQAGDVGIASVFQITRGAPGLPLEIITFFIPAGTFLNPVATLRSPVFTRRVPV